MSDTTARAQVALAFLYGAGFLAVLGVLVVSPPDANEFVKSMLLTMLGYLGALVQQQSSYFFARQRPNELPNSTTSVDQTTIIKTTPEKPSE